MSLTSTLGVVFFGVKNNDPASPAYVPTIFRHVKSPLKRKTEDAFERYKRTKACKKRRLDACQREVEAAAMAKNEAVDGLMRLSEAASLQVEIETGEICTSSVMTDVTMEDLSRLEQDIQQLREDNCPLREAITRQALDEQSLESDNNKVRFFTGLPSHYFDGTLQFYLSLCKREPSWIAKVSSVSCGADKTSFEHSKPVLRLPIWSSSLNNFTIFKKMDGCDVRQDETTDYMAWA